MDTSNRTLAYFLIAAIVISLAGTIISLNKLGRVTVTGAITTGNATLVIVTNASIKFVTGTDTCTNDASSVNWGSGYTTGTCSMTTITSESLPTLCANFSNQAGCPLFIENDGNVNLSVNLNASQNGTDLFGTTGTLYTYSLRWKVSNNGTSDCQVGLKQNETFIEVNKTNPQICSDFGYITGDDTLKVDMNVSFGDQATKGAKTSILTVTGTQI